MEFKGSQGFVAPQTVAILGTYDENGVPNAMNAAWCMQSDTAELSISLGAHKTTDNFMKTGAFTVAFATVKTLVISDYFGVESGRNVNKIEKAGVHVHKSAYVNAPVIEEYPLTITGSGQVNIEIFASPEKAGSGTDGWLIEAAKDFNNQKNRTSSGLTMSVSVRSISSGMG